MVSKTVVVEIYCECSMCFIPIPFDPKAVFGKVRAPVKVTLNGYTYRSTIASMGGTVCIPLRKSNREAAGLEGGETLAVETQLDQEARVSHWTQHGGKRIWPPGWATATRRSQPTRDIARPRISPTAAGPAAIPRRSSILVVAAFTKPQ